MKYHVTNSPEAIYANRRRNSFAETLSEELPAKAQEPSEDSSGDTNSSTSAQVRIPEGTAAPDLRGFLKVPKCSTPSDDEADRPP